MEIVRDTNERQQEEHIAVACVAVLPQDVQHLRSIFIPGDDAAVRAFSQEVKKAVGRMAIMAGEWEKGELAMSE
jgi:hypothetical protein